MIGINHFRDGDRLVVVFENFFKDRQMSDDDIVKNYLSVIAGEQNTCLPANVVPMDDVQEVPELPVVFEDGPFKGRTPVDLFMGISNAAEEKAVFSAFPADIDGFYSEELSSHIRAAMKLYLKKRFKKIDGAEYEAKLSDNQKTLFYAIYAPAINDPDKTISSLIEEWKK